MSMSNELATAKIIFCPSDTIHTGAATNFTYANVLNETFTTTPGTPQAAANVSYFVGGDATEADPQSIMAGDCNIGNANNTANNTPATARFNATAYNTTAGTPMNPATAASSTANNEWTWTATDLHQKTGNLLIADGSVQSATESGLHSYLLNATNTVLIPTFEFIW